MSTTPAQKDAAPGTSARSLTGGQITVLVIATIPMVVAGAVGAWGTYSNVLAVFPDNGTAAGVVAAGEGATFVLALVYVLLTLLGQTAPAPVRLGLWLLPVVASATGAKLATDTTAAVVYAVTPMAMCVSAEGIGLVARRVVVYCTGIDMEAQRRNAELMRRIGYQTARAQRHPWKWAQQRSGLTAWRLMSRAGSGDAQLGSELIAVQRTRLAQGADTALLAMLQGGVEPTLVSVSLAAEPVRPALEPGEPLPAAPTEPDAKPHPTDDEPTSPLSREEQQISTLAHHLKIGEPLTKNTAAQLLGVSPATAGRRLKAARERIGDGTGLYL
ncbi:hypothetical protein [Streptomyces sp. MBT51]|uniref:hypothetical protein n=1 Tax=Streptomyces sp. MBT51 TaxID=2800408 RepID=UPI00190BF8D7|nr:hypothetical protein [Streptomyces sp. MBT51]MBK3597046.1 hypothetical protein [Streptomyces sp. MBT51]